ncbi:MAG: LacI family transcriptional regulator [Clostridiales bacterium]|nr:LacI family transcriptional regulator [Clostridiales bacterium]
MSVTIKDVAKAAGVSVATVSRVLNGNSNVSESATELVNKTIKELRYSPNSLGRNLRKRETKTIMVIQPASVHSLYSEIVAGMQVGAHALGYDVISMTSYSAIEIENRQMNMLFNRTVDGAVLLGTQLTATEINKLGENYNIALCCESIEGANVLTVTVDDEQAAYDAVVALIKKGNKKIALISTNSKAFSSVYREKGYRRALADHNIEVSKDYIYKNTYDLENGAIAAEEFMSLEDKPTAIFAVSDLLAASAIKQATKMGIEVGKDLAILGFDNIAMCEMFIPSISTVSQPCKEMGIFVVEKIINNISNVEKDNKYYKMPHEVILRESTGD